MVDTVGTVVGATEGGAVGGAGGVVTGIVVVGGALDGGTRDGGGTVDSVVVVVLAGVVVVVVVVSGTVVDVVVVLDVPGTVEGTATCATEMIASASMICMMRSRRRIDRHSANGIEGRGVAFPSDGFVGTTTARCFGVRRFANLGHFPVSFAVHKAQHQRYNGADVPID